MYTYSRYGTRVMEPTANKPIKQEAKEPKDPKEKRKKSKQNDTKPVSYDNDYSNQFVHNRAMSTQFIRNVNNPTVGYPKLQRLKELKLKQVANHATKPYGVRAGGREIVPLLNKWVNDYGLQFDVIMIGALVENQFMLPLLELLPLYKLCSKPGFLFIWTTTANIKQLGGLLNGDKWNKKFRRSEELVFVPVDENSPYFPGRTNDGFYNNDTGNGNGDSLFRRTQWHCWMCITGTVRRSTDADLIHCNVDTDLQMVRNNPSKGECNNAVPSQIYKVAENFSNHNRRLHIVPCKTGYKLPVRLRKGWVIVLPDVLVDNFDPVEYETQLREKLMTKNKSMNSGGNQRHVTQYLVPQSNEIENLRPKSPV